MDRPLESYVRFLFLYAKLASQVTRERGCYSMCGLPSPFHQSCNQRFRVQYPSNTIYCGMPPFTLCTSRREGGVSIMTDPNDVGAHRFRVLVPTKQRLPFPVISTPAIYRAHFDMGSSPLTPNTNSLS